MKILVLNGPNLNLLGERKKEEYGDLSLSDINSDLEETFPDHAFTFIQSNHEGDLVDAIQAAKSRQDAIIINAGGYSHTSVAIRDAVEATPITAVEVHVSNIAGRESFRHDSLLSPVCTGCIFGFGPKGYEVAVRALECILD